MQTSRFEAHVRRALEAAVVELDGDVDAHAEAALERAYDDAKAAGARIVTLDFTSVGYINSTGIAVLVGLLARGRRDRVELEARGLSDHYREIFEITRIADFVRIVPDGDAS
jgi:anti-sigma B factor antagonist